MQEHIRSIASTARINLQEIQRQREEEELKEAAIYAITARHEISQIKGIRGSIDCPKCGNNIVWAKASNRYISACCRTKNCICFME